MSNENTFSVSCPPTYSEIYKSLASLMEKEAKYPSLTDIVLTANQASRIRELTAHKHTVDMDAIGYPDSLYGICVTVDAPSQSRMIKTGKIINHDRFAEYDRDDMVWAEPAGLAEWEKVGREEVIFGFNQRLMEMGSPSVCTGIAFTYPGIGK